MIIECQRLGIETIAVDRYANAPAMHVAHRHYVVNMRLIAVALKQIITQEKPDFWDCLKLEAIATSFISQN